MHTGREKTHHPEYFKSSLHVANSKRHHCFATGLRVRGIVLLTTPMHAKGKPALCPSVLPLKAWLYSARIWQSRSLFDASRPPFLG